jgi:hypothetical protein
MPKTVRTRTWKKRSVWKTMQRKVKLLKWPQFKNPMRTLTRIVKCSLKFLEELVTQQDFL